MPVAPFYQSSPIFLELGEGFADVVSPARFPKHILRFRNQAWAERVGLGSLNEVEWETHFARFEPLPRNLVHPLAIRYHGHQFRSYNPDLGDGRGFLFAQLKDVPGGRILDLGTKGSGQTPYSRGGDGRLTLKGAVREALATEMLESLGVDTSKTLSIFETGESLVRHDEPSPTRSGVLVRLNHSHIRFGVFQRLAFLEDKERIKKLVAYCIRHYFPHLETQTAGVERSDEPRIVDFLNEVVKNSAELCASWMLAGFVHGVLNTDNMNITGESFDYGPYRFLPVYDSSFTAAYFDHTGLYAYGRQPQSVLWNLERLAECLSLITDVDPLVESLQRYAPILNERVLSLFMDRLGLVSKDPENDTQLFMAAFDFLEKSQAEFEQFFHDWYGGITDRSKARSGPGSEKYKGDEFDCFILRLGQYQASEAARRRLQHPYFERSKACGLLIDEIEWIWDAIDKDDDWSRFEKKIAEIREMGEVYERRHV